MHRLARLSGAITASLVFSGSALAATFSTPTFTFDGVHDTWTLISAENGIVKVAVPGATTEVDAHATGNDWTSSGGYRAEGTFTAAPGWRLGTVTATGQMTGDLVGRTPDVTNSADVRLMAYSGSLTYIGEDSTLDLVGSEPVNATMTVNPGGPFKLLFDVYAEATIYRDFPLPSYYRTSMSVTDVVLTFQMVPVAAVPEPSAWAMLVGGLAVAGFAARRARKSAPASA
jgi:PEP-CTERM motif